MRKIILIIALSLFLVACNSTNLEQSVIESSEEEIISDYIFYKVEDKVANDNEFNAGSKIDELNLTDDNIENLKIIGKIWGFLKYYHPYVAKGEYNWDYELFRVLPMILEVEKPEERDSILLSWIASLGEYEAGNFPLKNESEIKKDVDFKWIEDFNLSQELVSQLTHIKNARRRLNNKYVNINSQNLVPIFSNEKSYAIMRYPDTGYRLLSLYRYWNIIEYYYPYKYLIEEDWNNVLEEFIPKFIKASDELDYQLVSLELITRINDSNAGIEDSKALENHLGVNYPPIKVTFVEGNLIVTGYYDKELGEESGLKLGDIISKISNKTVEEIVVEMEPYIPASNYPSKLSKISKDILRTNEDSLSIEFIRDDENYLLELACYKQGSINSKKSDYIGYSDSYYKDIDSDIGYMNIGLFRSQNEGEFIYRTYNKKGIIVDLRSYSLASYNEILGSYFLEESTEYANFTKTSLEDPGVFSFQDVNERIRVTSRTHYQGKLVLIINEETQGQFELATMLFKTSPNTIVIGSNSAGSNGEISSLYLPGYIRTQIPGLGVYYLDGGEIQRIGIEPDIVIHPTIEAIKEGRDELLEKAIEIIHQGE
ncbi:S41 family peptidase [Tissierella sp.]|uniref:S41 family peptidase n=1 Tax=Tissierella sp. TaxID=41274 RepID=UPI00286071DC|nr:S41 family peptidase [Tissierella sp.]MDR7857742.1 S41 family peptidase [Tissierella sp.]